MMRGIIVVITALMSIVFLKRKQYSHHILSLCLIVLGVAIVGVVGIVYSKDSDKDTTSGFGVVLLLAS
jgi:drug/metabolite transporter (DMT)-like permease